MPTPDAPDASERRSFLSFISVAAMTGGLVAAYGTLAAFFGRFLYPARGQDTQWMFVSDLPSMHSGQAVRFKTPGGSRVVIARQGRGSTADDFIALSSVCPHLGCQVHWEPQNDRFFCPCHNGVFSPQGVALEGPPAKAGTDLSRFPLKVEAGLLYIDVPRDELAQGPGFLEPDPPRRTAGHDPCLEPDPNPAGALTQETGLSRPEIRA